MRRLLVGLTLLAAACGHATSATRVDLSVLAASSLTGPFTEIGKQFHAAHPDVSVTFDFGASSTLAQQIQNGNSADVFASADLQNMQKVVAAHLAASPTTFGRNTLEIAVPRGNPKHVASLASLATPGTVVVLCASGVPCGKLADQVLARAGVHVTAASREDNVKAVLTKVSLGEADAGVVYVSDVKTAPASVAGVPIPSAQNAVTSYPIAVLKSSERKTTAREFVDFVTGPTGRATLARFGFLGP
jgi:molybdate transport system substrate-binding protein